jgi:hypothetical protein
MPTFVKTELARPAHDNDVKLMPNELRRTACQRTAGSPRGRTPVLHADGQQNSGWADTSSPGGSGQSQGLAHLDEALRKWAFGYGTSSDRASWLRQVRRLAALGEEYREPSLHLIAFANANANWAPMNAELLVESTDTRPGHAIPYRI